MQVTLGGQRLGSGNKQKVWLHNYERSSHDIGYVWRSTMAAGTLVPFMSELALPGDTFDINLNADVLTHPTIGPLFGSYKLQLDVFQVPIRLYQGMLHMNMLGIGMKMSNVKLPLMELEAPGYTPAIPIDNQHTNPSSIFAYLGVRGCGTNATFTATKRRFQAVPYLAYFDIYKAYYANKQEEIGVIIHKDPTPTTYNIINADIYNGIPTPVDIPRDELTPEGVACSLISNSYLQIAFQTFGTEFDMNKIAINVKFSEDPDEAWYPALLGELFKDSFVNNKQVNVYTPTTLGKEARYWNYIRYINEPAIDISDVEPKLVTFPLENIDTMRQNILSHTDPTAFMIDKTTIAPYGLPLQVYGNGSLYTYYSKVFPQEGLLCKTYNSDLFNNWISTEWIDGVDGISAITAIDTSGGSFTIDELNLSKKIYDMLNRIAVSGGSYDDWLDAVYTHNRQRNAENPMYIGGLMQTLVFQEVVSNAETNTGTEIKPLGTLAGRGKLIDQRKGGHIIAKVDEPSYIIGIASLTPKLDYSQGNKWDMSLLTLDDLHKPALDGIGFQDLVTDQMGWWETNLDAEGNPSFQSIGKQPAWLNYMTNVNQVRGNFADPMQQQWMTLCRRYEMAQGSNNMSIADLTTYIDPVKFNNIFADTRRDAQNFWVQIGLNIVARRKMSAKVMPNL